LVSITFLHLHLLEQKGKKGQFGCSALFLFPSPSPIYRCYQLILYTTPSKFQFYLKIHILLKLHLKGKMARLTHAQVLILLLSASMWAISMASRQYGFNNTDWSYKRRPCRQNSTAAPNKIVVGGSQNWTFGINYADWALKNGPFYFNDTLG